MDKVEWKTEQKKHATSIQAFPTWHFPVARTSSMYYLCLNKYHKVHILQFMKANHINSIQSIHTIQSISTQLIPSDVRNSELISFASLYCGYLGFITFHSIYTSWQNQTNKVIIPINIIPIIPVELKLRNITSIVTLIQKLVQ